MHDFPPVVPDFDSAADTTGARRGLPRRDFSHPDTRTPVKFLGWLLWQQAPLLLASSLVSVVEWLPGSVGPYVIGRIVDDGIRARDLGQVGWLSLIMLGLVIAGVAAGVLGHTLVVRGWLVGMYGPMKLVNRKAAQLGHVLPQRTPTGEVLSVSASDSDQFGAITEVISRAVGAFIAYLVIAGLVLSTSTKLGIAVLIMAPLIALLARPLLIPLQGKEEAERSRSSELTSLATDIVAGLRILRGIGGERTFARNYVAQSQRTRQAGVAASIWQGLVDSISVLFSGLFLVILTWLGAREVAAGALSIGELISFFGYAVFMVWPIQTFFDLAQKWVRAMVAARKTIAVLGQQPPWLPVASAGLPQGAALHDERSGFTAEPGQLTIVVSAVPDDTAALADRLGRYLPGDHEPVALDVDAAVRGRAARRERARQQAERARIAARDRALAERLWGVRLGGVDLAAVPIGTVRRQILVADSSSQVFAGTLQNAVDPHGRLSREEAEQVLHTAAAEDVFESLPGGWQGVIDERGRGLSGGQRQRLVLARALAVDPEVLILVEPTSAVDAHTEAEIAGRLARHRAGRTTVVTTVSPLLLHHADRVAFLAGDRVVAVGTHDELVRTCRPYRRVVARDFDHEEADPDSTADRGRERDD